MMLFASALHAHDLNQMSERSFFLDCSDEDFKQSPLILFLQTSLMLVTMCALILKSWTV